MSSTRLSVLAGSLAVVASASACLTSDSECTRDSECAGLCANTGECVPVGSTLFVQIRWTVAGQVATPEVCAAEGIDRLKVTVAGDSSEDRSWEPVPCAAGQFILNKLPERFDTVTVIALSSTDARLDEVSRLLAARGETRIDIDLVP